MFAHTGQLEEAKRYVPPRGDTGFWGGDDSADWEHNYLRYVWQRQPAHAHARPAKKTQLQFCMNYLSKREPRYTVVKLVRWPMSRAVSSFMYALSDMGYTIGRNWWVWQRIINNATLDGLGPCVRQCHQSVPKRNAELMQNCTSHCGTFESMITALEASANAEALHVFRPFICHDHVFPQASDCDRNEALRNATVYLPLESISHGLRALQTAANFTALPSMTARSKHKSNGTLYVQQVEQNFSHLLGGRDLARTPYKDIVALYGKGRSPPYRHFLTDPAIRERVRCLFAGDLRLYAHLCAQPLLRVSACRGRCLPSHCDDPVLHGLSY